MVRCPSSSSPTSRGPWTLIHVQRGLWKRPPSWGFIADPFSQGPSRRSRRQPRPDLCRPLLPWIAGGVNISLNDLIVKASALALRDVPQANGRWDEAAGAPGELTRPPSIDARDP